VQGLPAGARRLEVDHRLHRQGLGPHQRREAGRQPPIEQPVPAQRVPAVHVDHPRETLQRVTLDGLVRHLIELVGAGLAQPHEVVAKALHLRARKEPPHDEVALLGEDAQLTDSQLHEPP
jgi:hypothetical protein